ncbi:helix-turn-helix domain-containing protein [Promicromonospora sp. NPDC050880]|uniref:winged helix-turn-helix domain-containing protein n=1 Tax=Promicromonospora sp. NPDC050880 TaxID=3364406 RepID=UPI0037B79A86
MATADRTFPTTSVPTRRSRNLVLTGAISVALISTGSAYLAMVQFGVDVLAMNQGTAYATAGVFELSLVTVALLAREAARDNRPGGTLLALTWALSSASGIFAAWHEAYIGHPAGAVLFRFVVPLLAALMWHLALIGDRHLATGTSWSALRQSARMHALFLTTEDLFRAQSLNDGSRAARRRLAKAEAGRRRARSVALRTVPPTEMRAQVAAWCEALAAVGDGTADVARLHLADRARLTGILTGERLEPGELGVSGVLGASRTDVGTGVGVPDYEWRAAEAVAGEVGVPVGGVDGSGVFGGQAFGDAPGQGAPRPAGRRSAALDERRDRVTERAPAEPGPSGEGWGAGTEPRPFGEGRGAGREPGPPGEGRGAGTEPGGPAVAAGGGWQRVQAEAVDPVEAADRATANVREAIPPRRAPRRDTQLGTRAAERMIDLRAKGRTYREIAEEVGVSETTVRKRMREFTETGSIPMVTVR